MQLCGNGINNRSTRTKTETKELNIVRPNVGRWVKIKLIAGEINVV